MRYCSTVRTDESDIFSKMIFRWKQIELDIAAPAMHYDYFAKYSDFNQ